MLKFKKDKMLDIWVAKTDKHEYVIEKDSCNGLYYVYIDENNKYAKYATVKTLSTAKKYATEHYNK